MKLIKSFVYAWNGVRSCFKSESNFRVHLLAAFLVLLLSILLDISQVDWLIICSCIAFVLVTEMLNTAIEKLCDTVHPGVHAGIKKVKDIAAGAVLVAAIFSVIAGLVIFVPKIILYLIFFKYIQ